MLGQWTVFGLTVEFLFFIYVRIQSGEGLDEKRRQWLGWCPVDGLNTPWKINGWKPTNHPLEKESHLNQPPFLSSTC